MNKSQVVELRELCAECEKIAEAEDLEEAKEEKMEEAKNVDEAKGVETKEDVEQDMATPQRKLRKVISNVSVDSDGLPNYLCEITSTTATTTATEESQSCGFVCFNLFSSGSGVATTPVTSVGLPTTPGQNSSSSTTASTPATVETDLLKDANDKQKRMHEKMGNYKSQLRKKKKKNAKEEQKENPKDKQKEGASNKKKKKKEKQQEAAESPKDVTDEVGGGWQIITRTRGTLDKKAGTTYKIWVDPNGTQFRSLKDAILKGGFSKEHLPTD